MKRHAIGLICVFALAAFTSGPARSQQTPTPVIAVVDWQLLVNESLAGRSVLAQLDAKGATFRSEITEKENELMAADQELAKQQAVLTPEAFNERRRELQQRAAEVQREAQTRRRQLDQAAREAMRQVEAVLMEVVDELMAENGINIVLPKSQGVRTVPEMEITQRVLERVNERVTSVKVTLPEN